jgi:SAM-dependent methyltransferase
VTTGAPVDQPSFWDGLYASRGDRWELGGPAPPLVAHLHRAPPPVGRVAVPGCGRGHDARLLARRGYAAWGFDFAEAPIREARALAAGAGIAAVFEQRDVFGLAADYPGAFDGVWEYTSFCAVDPARRGEYVEVVRSILRPGGWLLACFYPVREGRGGPPFPATRDELERLWTPAFEVLEAYVPRTSAPAREGIEWMVFARERRR